MRPAVLVILAFLAFPMHAATVSHCGASVCYEYEDDPAQNPGIALLGAPDLLGNSNVLRFLPKAFQGAAAGGQTTIASEFRFSRVWSPLGLEIQTISAASFGDYQALGGGSVTTEVVLTAVDQANEGGGGGYPETATVTGAFGPAGPTGLPFLNWNLEAALSPADAFANLASSVSLSIAVRLDGMAPGSADGVFLAQKLLLVSATTVVPGPPALPLVLTGLAALIGFKGRRPRRAVRPAQPPQA